MSRFHDKVAVVTGGNSGIGFSAAHTFIAEGAHVVITGRNAQAVQDAVAALGPQAAGIVSDASRMSDLQQLAGQVQAYHGHVDVLFVNAGVSFAAPIAQVDEAHFDAQFDTNVKGAYFTMQQLLPIMNDGGAIVLNASATAHRAFSGVSVYSATKAALAAMARNFSVELLDRRIRVNVVSPGPIATPLTGKMFDRMGLPAEAAAQADTRYAQLVPMQRLGTPEEIASIVAFLASSDAAFVTGSEIVAGGGIGTL